MPATLSHSVRWVLCALILASWLLAESDEAPIITVVGEGGGDTRWMGEKWPMRMRISADYEAGVSFRLPYMLIATDQSKAIYYRIGQRGRAMVTEGQPSMRLVWNKLPETPAGDFASLADQVVGATLTWVPYDYYRQAPHRPFAAKPFAPPGVEALLGTAADRSALALRFDGRIAAVELLGSFKDRHELLDHVQAMPPPERKGAERRTWGEAQHARGVVPGPDGKPASPPANPKIPLAWTSGWEVETRHFHVTGHSSPALLTQRAKYLEALYRAYDKFFQPPTPPPLKFEVHIVNTWSEFEALSNACDNPLPVMPGSVLGGFFMPAYQSLWVYEESGKRGGRAMEIEFVMNHECSHQFLHMACNGSDHVPTWLNEGVAVYFENGQIQGNEYVWRPPTDRIAHLTDQYRRLKTTLVSPDQYLDHYRGFGGANYGEAYAMVHFWAFGIDGGRKRFLDYWAALRKGENGTKAFERIFMEDMVKAQGSREAALFKWRQLLYEYVVQGRLKGGTL